MHRYRIVARISLILSILNVVIAAPIMVQEMHDARGDETAVAGDVAAVPDTVAPPHPSSSEIQEVEDVAARPATVAPPHPSDSKSLQIPPPPQYPQEWEKFQDLRLQQWLQGLPPPHPSSSGPSKKPAVAEDVAAMPDAAASPHPSNSGSLQISPPSQHPQVWENWNLQRWLQGLPPPHSSSPGYYLELDEYVPPDDPTSQRPAPPRYWAWNAPRPPSTEASPDNAETINRNPPTGASPDNAGFFNRNMVKKFKFAAGALVVGGIISGIVASRVKHKHRDSQDS